MSTREWLKRHRTSAPVAWNVTMVMTSIVTALCCTRKLWADVTVFDDDEFWLTVGLLLAIPVAVWSTLVVVACLRYTGWWRPGLLVPAFVAVTVALAGFSVPGRIGWMTTRSDMNQAAASCDTLESGRSANRYIGETIGLYKFITSKVNPTRNVNSIFRGITRELVAGSSIYRTAGPSSATSIMNISVSMIRGTTSGHSSHRGSLMARWSASIRSSSGRASGLRARTIG